MSSTPFIFLTLAFVTLAFLAAWAIRAESLDQRAGDAEAGGRSDRADGSTDRPARDP